MRSYLYHEGQWEEYQDPLPPEARYIDFPPLHDEVLPSLTGDYEAAKKHYEEFLNRFGYRLEDERYTCLLGRLHLASRDLTKLPAKRGAKDLADFFCVLRFNGTYIRVWVPDLPNLLLFLREVEAQKESKKDAALTTFLTQFEDDASLGTVAYYANRVLQDLLNGELEIVVKPPTRKR